MIQNILLSPSKPKLIDQPHEILLIAWIRLPLMCIIFVPRKKKKKKKHYVCFIFVPKKELHYMLYVSSGKLQLASSSRYCPSFSMWNARKKNMGTTVFAVTYRSEAELLSRGSYGEPLGRWHDCLDPECKDILYASQDCSGSRVAVETALIKIRILFMGQADWFSFRVKNCLVISSILVSIQRF